MKALYEALAKEESSKLKGGIGPIDLIDFRFKEGRF